MNRHFSKEDMHRVQTQMNACSASLANREMQIKTTIRYHLPLLYMAIISRSTSAGEDVEKKNPNALGRNIDWYSH